VPKRTPHRNRFAEHPGGAVEVVLRLERVPDIVQELRDSMTVVDVASDRQALFENSSGYVRATFEVFQKSVVAQNAREANPIV